MSWYTLIFEFKGGTYISQVNSTDIDSAFRLWAEELDTSDIVFFGEEEKKELLGKIPEEDFVEIDFVKNIWISNPIISGEVTTVHAIKTDINR